MNKKPKFVNISGWTPEELEALDMLVKLWGLDRSKLIRKLVREAAPYHFGLVDDVKPRKGSKRPASDTGKDKTNG